MKRVFSALLAGAMTVAMAVPAFATSPVTATIYNSDGESIVGSSKDVYDATPSVPFVASKSTTYSVDGIVPGITMYIPLQKTMSTVIKNGAGTTPGNADIVAQLDTDDFKAVTTLTAGNKYLNADLDDSVPAVLGSASKDEIADKLVAMSYASTDATTPSAGGTYYLNEDADGYVEGDGSGFYQDGDNNYIKFTSTTPADISGQITAATDAVKADNTTATGAYKNGSTYYETSLDAEDIVAAVATAKAAATSSYIVTLDSLTNTDYFKFDVDKDDGSKYVSKIEVVDDKKLNDLSDRTAFLKVTLADSTTTSDLKTSGTITFKAKADSSTYTSGSKKLTNGDVWKSGDTFTINYTFWLNNVKTSNDSNVETGDRVYFDPDDNEDNTLVWGDDRAALFFEANDDANKFYARLQTKSDAEIYSTYGDPVNADLWFFDFVGNPTIPSTSRATLTLGIPWDEDDDYTPNPEDCFIYEKDADGNLTDVTSQFTYDEDNDGTTEIPGWTIKTRTLGTYVISDTELDTTVVDDVDEEPADDTASTVDGGKEIPNTGSSDMVGVAVVAAVVSLAAAGAVAFKKASK